MVNIWLILQLIWKIFLGVPRKIKLLLAKTFNLELNDIIWLFYAIKRPMSSEVIRYMYQVVQSRAKLNWLDTPPNLYLIWINSALLRKTLAIEKRTIYDSSHKYIIFIYILRCANVRIFNSCKSWFKLPQIQV